MVICVAHLASDLSFIPEFLGRLAHQYQPREVGASSHTCILINFAIKPQINDIAAC
jgi:hypothetical protein